MARATMTMDPKNAVVAFDPKEVGNYGVAMLKVLIQHDKATDAAKAALAESDKRSQVIDFELTKCALHLHNVEDAGVDLYRIFTEKKADSTALYQQILVATGAMTRQQVGDTITYQWADKALANEFDFNEELRKKDEAEYKRRRGAKTKLNMRLNRCVKAAVAMLDAGLSPEHMVIEQTANGPTAKLLDAPKEVKGTVEGEIQIVSTPGVKPVEGATVTPTISGMAKVAEKSHRADEGNTESTGSAAEGGNSEGNVSDEDMLAMIAALQGAIMGRERTFTETIRKSLHGLASCIVSELELNKKKTD